MPAAVPPRATPAAKAGVPRAVGFAAALEGEAALLAGDLDAAAQTLAWAVEHHRAIGSVVGEAHSLQRLAEARLAAGDTDGARTLLARALPLARWSNLAPCLLPRVYGTQVVAAPDPAQAHAAVDEAVAALGPDDACFLCSVTFDAPATRACADAGDLEAARRHLAAAELSARRWNTLAWDAAVIEARAHVARAEGDAPAAADLWARAAEAFTRAGQPLDASRCRANADADGLPGPGRFAGATPAPAAGS